MFIWSEILAIYVHQNQITNMKKVLFALTIVATGFLASCGGNQTSESAAPADTTVVETAVTDTSVSTEADTTAATTDTTAAN